MLTKLTCSSCGANHLTCRGDAYECDYCGATYLIETDRKGKPSDAKVSGTMQDVFEVFAVHGRMKVSGNMNDVEVLKRSREARHVRDLVVTGNMNHVSVVLLDGATCEVSGNMNEVRRI